MNMQLLMNQLLQYMKYINATFVECYLVFDGSYIGANPSDKFHPVSKFISRISAKKIGVNFNDHPNKYKCFGTIWKMMCSLRDKKTNINVAFRDSSEIYQGALHTVLSLKKSELTKMKWKLDNENADEDNDEDDKVVCKKIIRFFTGTASQN